MRQQLLPWLASAVIVLGGAVLALLWISDGARSGFTAGQLLQVIAALAVMTTLARAAVNVNRISLHDVYRWRLADAFAVTRRAAQEPEPGKHARPPCSPRPPRPACPSFGTEARRPHEPGLVICGTANINADREVPPGSGGFCVSFDPEARHLAPREPAPKGRPTPRP